VGAEAEADVLDVGARDVEAVWFRKPLCVAVGGGEHHHITISGGW
jgi:hypothetical protein